MGRLKQWPGRGQGSSIRYKWTAYFLAVLLIPLLFNTSSYLIYSHKIENEINTKNTVFFENIANELEMDISRYRKIGLELGAVPSIRTLGNISSGSVATDEQIASFKNALKQYYFYLYNAYDFYVCFDNLGMIGSSSGLKDSQSSFESLCGGLDVTYEEWREWIASSQEMYQVLKSKTNLTDVSSKFTLLKFPLYTNPQQQNTNLIIVIRDAYFSYQIEKVINDDKVQAEMYDKYDTLISTTFNSDDATQPVRGQLMGASGLLEANLQDGAMIVQYTTLPAEGWKLVFYTPKNHYYLVSRHLNQIALLMLLALAAGLLMIHFLVKRQYSPVKQIIKSIPSKVKGKNEYTRIQNMMTESLKEHRKNEVLYEKHEKNQFDRFLIQMLNTSGPSPVLDDIKQRLGNFFLYPPNQIILLPLDGYTQLFPDEGMPDYERLTLLTDMLENVGNEVLAQHHVESYFLESGGNLVILASLPKGCDSYIFNEYLEEFLDLIKQHLSVSLTAGVSQPCAELYGLPQAYQEALSCLEYMRLNPEDRIVFYEDIAKEQVTANNFSAEEASALIRYIQQGDQQGACAYMEDRFRRFVQTAGMQPMAFQYYVHDVINTLMKNFQAYISEETQTSINVLHLQSVSKSVNAASIQLELTHLIQSICARIDRETSLTSEGGTKKSSLAYQIKDYIDHNYTDQALCTESIAQEFGITSTYVSKLFKSIEDSGFVNYVNTKRIETAKQLLTETNLKIDGIMAEAGFLNASSFIRLFKAHEGITPGNYRKLHQK